ncbi:TolC family protein [Glacieibacterium sp.]|uniref:TolC family protein n=1 Tax=Glacieibacterium sp. TaxID=2860237 RepID=UPI003AFF9A79
MFKRAGRSGACGLLLCGAAALAQPTVAVTPPAAAISLPEPSGAPQSIDFDRDPLIRFSHAAVPARPFLDTLGRAVEVHPNVAAAIADAQSREGVRTQVRAGLFPQVDASLVTQRSLANRFQSGDTFIESLAPRTRADAVINADQLIYDFGATGSRISAANDRIRAARAEVERVAGDTALRAVNAWYNVLGYQMLVELSDAMAKRQRAILADVRTRVVQGFGAAGDVARAEAVLADTEVQAARYGRALEQARGRYRETFGTDAPDHLSRPLPPRSEAQSLDNAQAMSRQSPAVAAALRRAEAARRDYRAARADGLPRLSAGVNGSRYDVFTGSDYDVRGTISLRQSLFAGGAQRGRIDEASAVSRQAGFIADQVINESERDAGIAFTDVKSLTITEATLETAYIANRRSRDSYVEQFRVSRGTLIELLRAEQDYYSAAANYLQGIIELDVARYALLTRTGEILPAVGVKLSTAPM